MKRPEYVCPDCGEPRFELCITQLVDVVFFSDGDHIITDGPRGDLEWSDDTKAICNNCHWSGTLKEAKGR